MTATTATKTTAQKLAEMLTENTGRNLLDSGSAYGRAWERNAGKTVDDFKAEPTNRIDSDGSISLSTFHHLNDALSYDADLDAMYSAFDALHPNEGYIETVYLWLETLGVDTDNSETYGGVWTYNSYNSEFDLLDQTIQAVFFDLGGRAFVALQIHGGCDVRGGYTKPAIFEGGIDELLSADRAWLSCPALDHSFTADFYEGSVQDTELSPSEPTDDMLIPVTVETQLPEGWELQHGCPICKSALV